MVLNLTIHEHAMSVIYLYMYIFFIKFFMSFADGVDCKEAILLSCTDEEMYLMSLFQVHLVRGEQDSNPLPNPKIFLHLVLPHLIGNMYFGYSMDHITSSKS